MSNKVRSMFFWKVAVYRKENSVGHVSFLHEFGGLSVETGLVTQALAP